ncbi:hypothetical protein BK816_07825 [Boudabousia tangfeifanii]|uniref:ABC transporter domain-containing protein n=2 Tax=Boudabousia tangfeifanii TaxID=1912795 RepID=A0A1D9MM38_9ACTO|nr:hypothetical protein BK816_07825 [Boudabousia tangfeifanii]
MEPTLAVENLNFRYAKNLPLVIKNFSYDFPSGAAIALTGQSGCGKSTLLYLCGLLLNPSSGQIWLNHENTTLLNDQERSRRRNQNIGFVFQNAELDAHQTILTSVIEPAYYAGSAGIDSRRRAMKLLEIFGVSELANSKPTQISGGQAARAALARAFLLDPPIILADEPTGNLDPKNTKIVLDSLLGAARENKTIIIATHDPRVIEQCDLTVQL